MFVFELYRNDSAFSKHTLNYFYVQGQFKAPLEKK